MNMSIDYCDKQTSTSLLQTSVELYDHYEAIDEVKHYYGLLAIYGLIKTAQEGKDEVLLNRCRAIVERFPDRIDHPDYHLPAYRIGGIPRAYMLFQGYMTDALTSDYVTAHAQKFMLAPRDDRGILCMPHTPADQLIWIDVAMAVTPYLLFSGLAMNEPRWVDEAAQQTFRMYRVFVNPDNGLLHQSLNFRAPSHLSQDHWGRGNGWGYFALTELVQHLPADSPHRPEAERLFCDHSRALLPHQSERGLWRQEIPQVTAWEESSATGLILYGYGVGLRCGLLDPHLYRPALHRGIQGVVSHCINDDFSTERCCPGCLCPGEGEAKGTVHSYVTLKGPVVDDPHSFGPLMLALTESVHHGSNPFDGRDVLSEFHTRATASPIIRSNNANTSSPLVAKHRRASV